MKGDIKKRIKSFQELVMEQPTEWEYVMKS